MANIVIGIPCYDHVSPETLEDYTRFCFYLGRNTDHDYFMAIKSKSEQFRARNSIVDAAIQIDADYLLFLDDDHVINWENSFESSSRYGFVEKLVRHLEDDSQRAIVGCLYYHRGGECRPVLMKQGDDGGYYYMRDDEITGSLQEVAVQGGGCMLIDMNLFSRIPSPWFEPETGLGTDLQICQKAKEAGRTVWCDTSIVLGHVKNAREVVTPKNRHRIISESGQIGKEQQGMDQTYAAQTAYNEFALDVMEYLQADHNTIQEMADSYYGLNVHRFNDFDNPEDYYKSLGNEQLARQVWFHSLPEMIDQMQVIHNFINCDQSFYGLDYGCGSSPVGFEFALKGHKMDFVDLDGAPAYEFLKWRANYRGIADRCGWKLNGPYDYALFLDSIEHFKDWKNILTSVVGCLKDDGVIITNYFFNNDTENIEHISMDQDEVKRHLISLGVYPTNEMVWVKRDLSLIGKVKAA